MRCSQRYRFYPTPAQEDLLIRTLGCARYVYNRALVERKAAWREHRRSLSYKQTSVLLTTWKADPETAWLKEPSCVPLQQALRHLDNAYQRFFNRLARYPTPRRKHNPQGIEFTRSAFRLRDGELYLAKMKEPLDIRWSRALPSYPNTVSISREPDGCWYVSFRVDVDSRPLDGGRESIGLDLGITTFATLSTGEKVKAPKPLQAMLKRLTKAQRRHARAHKGGKNRERRRRHVARLHSRIRNIRSDFLHKLSSRLICENQAISIETLNVKGMMKNRKSARAISDLGWSEFVRQLEYKAQRYGRILTKVSPWFASSKTCSGCREKRDELPPQVRAWSCTACGAVHDRDINAALNIDAAGLAVRACGGDVSQTSRKAALQSPLKQEISQATAGISAF